MCLIIQLVSSMMLSYSSPILLVLPWMQSMHVSMKFGNRGAFSIIHVTPVYALRGAKKNRILQSSNINFFFFWFHFHLPFSAIVRQVQTRVPLNISTGFSFTPPLNPWNALPAPLKDIRPLPAIVDNSIVAQERQTYYFYYRLILMLYNYAYWQVDGVKLPNPMVAGWENKKTFWVNQPRGNINGRFRHTPFATLLTKG